MVIFLTFYDKIVQTTPPGNTHNGVVAQFAMLHNGTAAGCQRKIGDWEHEYYVGFEERLWQNVLGQSGFFDFYSVEFNLARKEFSVNVARVDEVGEVLHPSQFQNV